MNKLYFSLTLSLALTSASAAAPTTAAAKPNALATVALPTYIDATGSKNYGYLAGSLTDAIDASMQQKFDYARADKNAVERETKKLWRPGKIPLDADVKQIAILTRSDYVIVGSYSLSQNKKEIIFSTRVYIAPDRFITVPEISNAVDATLFDATNRVATEIVRAIEADALREQAKLAAAPKPEGGKITLAKAAEKPPEPQKEVLPDLKFESGATRSTEKSIGVGINHHTNYFERHTQFYRYASALTSIDADVYFGTIRLLGQLAYPKTPTGNLIPTTYENINSWTLGIETDSHSGDSWITYGINYRSFSKPNPAGLYPREVLDWSSTIYFDGGVGLFNIGPVRISLDYATYLDIMGGKPVAKTTSDLFLLWNIEGDVRANYTLPVIHANLGLSLGTSVAIYDQTSELYVLSFGDLSLDGNSRAGKASGMRIAVDLNKSFYGITLRLRYVNFPNITTAFQPLDNQNVRRSSLSYFTFGAEYRLAFGR
ncbi:hypothetical protein [Turneriella parva]|uniref:Curli production assembly/transport component CsgG n=1 Tax=Turneriella parva (strain ATCC BAA-1111 / DSM 21527 / NCTC 11395 / H) TaxID=869212 RepID=I4B3P6_TURPD|nr:hypothetical protein [Turneriella parva]AFM11903.1 hypothetical protein Turpa_1255 [Turneriella parva DSM 21527]